MFEPDQIIEEKGDPMGQAAQEQRPEFGENGQTPPESGLTGHNSAFEPPFVPLSYSAETQDDSVRKSGLAWSMGVVFFGSVVFMFFLGWIADLVLGTSPWGVVGGIVVGSAIGFVQFFRISSQINSTSNRGPKEHPLLPHDDENL